MKYKTFETSLGNFLLFDKNDVAEIESTSYGNGMNFIHFKDKNGYTLNHFKTKDHRIYPLSFMDNKTAMKFIDKKANPKDDLFRRLEKLDVNLFKNPLEYPECTCTEDEGCNFSMELEEYEREESKTYDNPYLIIL